MLGPLRDIFPWANFYLTQSNQALGNKVTLTYPNIRAPYNFVNVNFDVADGFNIHVDVETKKDRKKCQAIFAICVYKITFIWLEQYVFWQLHLGKKTNKRLLSIWWLSKVVETREQH